MRRSYKFLSTLAVLSAVVVSSGCAYYRWDDGYYYGYGVERPYYRWPRYHSYGYYGHSHYPWRPYRPYYDYHHNDYKPHTPKPRPRYQGPGSAAKPDRTTRPRAQGFSTIRRLQNDIGRPDRR